jgi:type VI secretion system protein ImpG
MNRNFLQHYEQELLYVRQMAGEFAREYPKIAGRLALDSEGSESCPDPFVERLLEGFAFLSARVSLKLDAEFPRFTQALLETVFPHFLAPLPSMGIVRFQAEPDAPGEGFLINRGTVLRSIPGGAREKGEVFTSCSFRTAHSVRLLPLRILQAQYYTRDLSELDLPHDAAVAAALRLRLQTLGNQPVAEVDYNVLTFFLSGGELGALLYEQLFGRALNVMVRPVGIRSSNIPQLPADSIRPVGFAEEEALLPPTPRSYDGYRLLREYFMLPERFLFCELNGLKTAALPGDQLDIIITFKTREPRLERRVQPSCFELGCAPVVNLFPKQLDEIHLTDHFSEFLAIPDRTRPLDFEVYDIQDVTGVGELAGQEQVFRPFYWSKDDGSGGEPYYTLHRVERQLTAREKRLGARSDYVGSDVFISLCDGDSVPYESRQSESINPYNKLRIRALCSNRHLPIQMTVGEGHTDFDIIAGPVQSIRCIIGPTPPKPSCANGEFAWRLISHLSLNYLSLLDKADEGAAPLRELLGLYLQDRNAAAEKQIQGLRSVRSKPDVRRVDVPGPICFARGLEITLLFDEDAFHGAGLFLFGAVLQRFFARYVSLNSFTETVITSLQRKEIMRWPPQLGRRPIL